MRRLTAADGTWSGSQPQTESEAAHCRSRLAVADFYNVNINVLQTPCASIIIMLLCAAHIYVYRNRTCHHSVTCIGGNSIAVADIVILTDYIELRAVGDNIGI